MRFSFLLCGLIVFAGCQPTVDTHAPTYHKSVFSSIRDIDINQPALPTGILLEGEWQIDTTDATGGLNPNLPTFDSPEKRTLPHRILLPDHAIWYRQTVALDRGVLAINADDGAQLWVNGTRVPHLFSHYFPIAGNEEPVEITIRVLNNAMHGGLRSVRWIAEEDWEDYTRQQAAYEQALIDSAKSKLLLDQSIDDGVALLTDPVWQRDSSGASYLTWVSESAGQAVIRWGSEPDQLRNELPVSSANGVFQVQMPVVERTIYYQLQQGNSFTKVYSFTPKTESNNFRFAAWGDSQGGWTTFNAIINLMANHQPDFSVGAGDLVSHGDQEIGYLHFLQALSNGAFYHYPVPGNHDYDGFYEDLVASNYTKYLGIPGRHPYFAWTYGNAAFIAIDPNINFPVDIAPDSEQYSWFQDQVSSPGWKEAEWHIVLLHQPPFSQGWPGYHGEQSIVRLLDPLLQSGELDMVIAGHSHDYERLLSIYGDHEALFVVVGGGGGGIEPAELSDWPVMDTVIKQHHYGIVSIRDTQLSFVAYNLEDQLMDSVTISH